MVFSERIRKMIIPTEEECAGKEVDWYRKDSESTYTDNLEKGEKLPFGPQDIKYKFNSNGYRCPEFDSPKKKARSCFYGCSMMEGYGLPEELTLPMQFAKKTDTEAFNLAKASASNDYISRMILQTTPILNPDVVVVLWTYTTRRELYTEEGHEVKWIKNWRLRGEYERSGDESFMEAAEALCNVDNNINNFVKNYNVVKYFLESKKIPWMWGLVNVQSMFNIMPHLDTNDLEICCGFDLSKETCDLSRDLMHPGSKTIEKFSDAFVEIYKGIE